MKRVTIKYRSAQLEKRRGWQKGLKAALEKLQGDGISFEQIGVDLHVTRDTVQMWMEQKRCPKFPTIKYIEQIYGVKIL